MKRGKDWEEKGERKEEKRRRELEFFQQLIALEALTSLLLAGYDRKESRAKYLQKAPQLLDDLENTCLSEVEGEDVPEKEELMNRLKSSVEEISLLIELIDDEEFDFDPLSAPKRAGPSRRWGDSAGEVDLYGNWED